MPKFQMQQLYVYYIKYELKMVFLKNQVMNLFNLIYYIFLGKNKWFDRCAYEPIKCIKRFCS